MKELVYSATMLNGTGRKGIIKPDAAGYYTQCIGALGIKNAAGVVYDARIGAKLFEDSSELMRRIKSGNLKGEDGHPRRQAGMTDQQWFARCVDILESNVCVYWAEVGLDPDYGKKNPDLGMPEMCGIMGRFRPGGARGDFLARDMEDPLTNVCFSIRAFSEPFKYMGRPMYGLQAISTWDRVIEPGLSPANKWQSLTCENLDSSRFSQETLQGFVEAVSSNDHTVNFESSANARAMAQTFELMLPSRERSVFFTGWKN